VERFHLRLVVVPLLWGTRLPSPVRVRERRIKGSIAIAI